MNKSKTILIAVAVILLLSGAVSAYSVPVELKNKNQLEVVEYLLAEHDAGRDTAYGTYQLMIYTDAFTSRGYKAGVTVQGNYADLRRWVEKHKGESKITRNNMVRIND